jgi:hypothetical protein
MDKARTKLTASESAAAVSLERVMTELRKQNKEKIQNQPAFEKLETFYRYVKSNMAHVYRYHGVTLSHPSIHVSIQHPSKGPSHHGDDAVHKIHLANGTKFSLKCSTEEIHALFLAMLNYNILDCMHYRFYGCTVHRVGEDDDAKMYEVPVSMGVGCALDAQLESINKYSINYQNDFDKLIDEVRGRIKNNAFTYYAMIHAVHTLKIVISSSTLDNTKMQIEMSYPPVPPPPAYFINSKYSLHVEEAETLIQSMGDMLSHLPANCTDKLTKIVREDVQDEIKYVDITSNISKHPFGDVALILSKYVGMDPEKEEYNRIRKTQKRAAVNTVFGHNVLNLSSVLQGKKPKRRQSNAGGGGGGDNESISAGSSSHSSVSDSDSDSDSSADG